MCPFQPRAKIVRLSRGWCTRFVAFVGTSVPYFSLYLCCTHSQFLANPHCLRSRYSRWRRLSRTETCVHSNHVPRFSPVLPVFIARGREWDCKSLTMEPSLVHRYPKTIHRACNYYHQLVSTLDGCLEDEGDSLQEKLVPIPTTFQGFHQSFLFS